MAKYVVAHGSLKVGVGVFAKSGEEVELDAEWVKKNDPRAVQFVTVEDWSKLKLAADARAALTKKHAAEAGAVSEKQKAEMAAAAVVHEKHLATIASKPVKAEKAVAK
jgi:hypothetical protein